MGSDQVGIKLGKKHVTYIIQRKRINLIADMKRPSLANNCVYRPEYIVVPWCSGCHYCTTSFN